MTEGFIPQRAQHWRIVLLVLLHNLHYERAVLGQYLPFTICCIYSMLFSSCCITACSVRFNASK